jgi:hypothetical protein
MPLVLTYYSYDLENANDVDNLFVSKPFEKRFEQCTTEKLSDPDDFIVNYTGVCRIMNMRHSPEFMIDLRSVGREATLLAPRTPKSANHAGRA